MPDPFDALRIGRNAVNPPDDFAGRLRGRLREELGLMSVPTTTTASGLRELYYATITVQDLDRGLRFFNELFGWTPNAPHVIGDRSYVNMNAGVSMGIHNDPDSANLWFAADDLEAALDAVRRAGGTVEEGGGDADSVVCHDDQGVRFGLGRQTYGPVTPIPSIPFDNIGYVTINVPDGLRGRRFYGDVLGWRFDGGLANPGYIAMPMGLAEGAAPGHTLFVKVADAAAKADQVRALGGTAGEESTSESGITIECTDDQGTYFALWQPAPAYS
ncbi:MAG: uncharacterized protein V7636_426 [Actinomycetota bacterium]